MLCSKQALQEVLASHHHRPGQVSPSPLALTSFLPLPAQDASDYEFSCTLSEIQRLQMCMLVCVLA